jgi:diaminopropionate ammonia-lyase
MPDLAKTLGVRQVFVKDESERLGLPAFKVLGSSWAVIRLIARELEKTGVDPWKWDSVDDLRKLAIQLPDTSLVTASDGNHGRGLARVAQWLEIPAHVFMPAGTAPARVDAIRSEGAEVVVLEGNHDDAVRHASEYARSVGGWLIQDTSWPGYTEVPGWIVEGYATLLDEIEEALGERDQQWPDVMMIPFGTGALAGAIIPHLRGASPSTRLITVEPFGAECALESLTARESIQVKGHSSTVMAGLNCNSVATIVLDALFDGVNAAMAVDDGWALDAVCLFHHHGVTSGESGASSLGGLMALLGDSSCSPLRERLKLSSESTVLLINTEGVTDPVLHSQIVEG